MISIPALSITLFIFIFVPSSYIGFKKGWKGALLFSILLFSFTGIWIAIAYIMTNTGSQPLWKLYRNLFLDKNIADGLNFNIDDLKGIYVSRIILLFSGLLIPFTYLFSWGIYKLFKRPLQKHLAPKTMEVNANEKTIVSIPKTKSSKIIGGSITIFSSLFMISYIGAAVNAWVTPYNKRNWFNTTIDSIGGIYGFGSAVDGEIPYYVDEFIKELDGPVAQGMQELIGVKGEYNKANGLPNLKIIEKMNANKSLFEMIFKYDEPSKAVFKAILGKVSEGAYLQPLSFSKVWKTRSQDTFGNLSGFSVQNESIFINDIKAHFANHKLPVYLTDEVKKVVYEKFNDSIVPESELIFVYEKNRAIEDQKKAESDLNKIINELSQKKISFNELKIERDNWVQELESLIDPGWKNFGKTKSNISTTHPEAGYAETKFAQNTYDANMAKSNPASKLAKYEAELTNLKNILTTKTTEANIAKDNFNDKDKNFITNYQSTSSAALITLSHTDALSEMSHKKRTLNTSENEKTQASNLLNERKKNKTDQENIISSSNRSISTLTNEINTLTNEISNLQQQITNQTSTVASATTDMNNKKSIERATSNAFTDAKNQSQQDDASLSPAERALSAAISQQNDSQKKVNDLQAKLNSLQSQDPNYSSIQSQLSSAQSQLNADKASVTNETQARDAAKTTADRSKSIANQKNIDYNNAKKAADAATTYYKTENNKKSNLINDEFSKSSDLKYKKNEKTRKEKERDDAQVILDTLNASASTQGSIAWAQKNLKNKQAQYNADKSDLDAFTILFNNNESIYQNLRSISIAKDKTKAQANQNVLNKQQDINKAETRSKELFKKILDQNTYLKNNSDAIETLLKEDVVNKLGPLNLLQQNAIQSFGGDDKSIQYKEALVQEAKERVKNTSDILESAKNDYKNIKRELLDAYKGWLGI